MNSGKLGRAHGSVRNVFKKRNSTDLFFNKPDLPEIDITEGVPTQGEFPRKPSLPGGRDRNFDIR